MPKVGYASLVETLRLRVSPPARPAFVDTSVNRRVDTGDRILFPTGVALADTPLGHLEFALRHEGIDLAIIASALPAIGAAPIVERLRQSPNGEYIRRAALAVGALRPCHPVSVPLRDAQQLCHRARGSERDGLRETMAGWEAFVNDRERGVDPLVKAACGAFGFVHLHPFMDGNGRLHRFMIHHLLAQSGLVPGGMVIPVSAVIMKHIPEAVSTCPHATSAG